MRTVRLQVLYQVRSQRVVTATEVGKMMQMTPANARHHLKILAEQGVVTVVGLRATNGKGRPEKLYGLTDTASGHNLGWLAGALLEELQEGRQVVKQQPLMQSLAGRLYLDCLQALGITGTPVDQGQAQHLTQRLFQAVRALNSIHYDARWEAHAIAPRLILGRCPYAMLIDRHPEICEMDRDLIQRLSGAEVQQITRLQPDRRGLRQCVFAIKK
jgi:predicted ArsR family transcriptional regulator